jgi:hypothetical protein
VAGTYVVGVSGAPNLASSPSAGGSGSPGSLGGYQLGLSFVPFEDPSNDTRATATVVPLEVGGAVRISGLVGDSPYGAKDVDFYRIDVVTGATLVLETHDSLAAAFLVFDDTLSAPRIVGISDLSGWYATLPLLAGSHFIGAK